MEYQKQSDTPTGEEKQTPSVPQATNDKIESVRKGTKMSSLGSHTGGAQRTVITYDQFSEMDTDDPIAAQIYASEKKLSEISITGKTTINN
jgi:hypothetical protein